MTNKIKQSFVVIALVNNDKTLMENLMRSPMIASGEVKVHVIRDAISASKAYNEAIEEFPGEIKIFAHQDIYFPGNWLDNLKLSIRELNLMDAAWVWLAPFGVSNQNIHVGEVWSSSLGGIIGAKPNGFVEAQSFDEMTLILNADSDSRFDERLPGFHLFGTDIVCTAKANGKKCYISDLPLVHNDSFHKQLGADFVECYLFMLRKWFRELPIRTPVLWIDWVGWSLCIQRLKMWKSIEKRRSIALNTDLDPQEIAQKCNWEKPSESN